LASFVGGSLMFMPNRDRAAWVIWSANRPLITACASVLLHSTAPILLQLVKIKAALAMAMRRTVFIYSPEKLWG
jgi:hypothetical protein